MNRIFIATSLDGYIATADDGLGWLDELPNPDRDDYGFADFLAGIDAIVMGRRTFDVVRGFRPWPYDVPVLVATGSTVPIPEDLGERVRLVRGTAREVNEQARAQGFISLYIDGGRLITSFLEAGLIDEMTIARLPVLLGAGIPLFGALTEPVWWNHESTRSYPSGIVQSTYSSKRS